MHSGEAINSDRIFQALTELDVKPAKKYVQPEDDYDNTSEVRIANLITAY